MRDITEECNLPGGGVATFVNGKLRHVKLADDTELTVEDRKWIVEFSVFDPFRGQHEIAVPDDKLTQLIVHFVTTCKIKS